jgi:hypothetical protein
MDNLPDNMPEKRSEILFYQMENGKNRIQVRLEGGTVWLSLNLIADLFQRDKSVISRHIKNVFDEGELPRDSVVSNYATTAADGKTYQVEHYNLDVIISVGYRVKSHRGTQFRIWATQRLREYLVKGFTMDDVRLKEGRTPGADYFDELLERIRDIRASEKRFYQKIRDLYTLSIDYDPKAGQTLKFFRIVQNKLHWAISGKTAAEIIHERADASKPNMGLTNWKGAKVRTEDVTVAKNYLKSDEIAELNRIVVMYLDYAEDQARHRKPLYMRDWREKLDAFLKFNEREILQHAGKVSMEVAHALALDEYEKFNRQRLAEEAEREALEENDFDATARRIESEAKEHKALPPKRGKRHKKRDSEK